MTEEVPVGWRDGTTLTEKFAARVRSRKIVWFRECGCGSRHMM